MKTIALVISVRLNRRGTSLLLVTLQLMQLVILAWAVMLEGLNQQATSLSILAILLIIVDVS